MTEIEIRRMYGRMYYANNKEKYKKYRLKHKIDKKVVVKKDGLYIKKFNFSKNHKVVYSWTEDINEAFKYSFLSAKGLIYRKKRMGETGYIMEDIK